MDEEILDDFSEEVKKIEEEAEKILQDAEKQEEEIISNAKTDSVTLIGKRQKELENKADAKVKRQKEKIDQHRQDIIKEGTKEQQKSERKFRKNIPNAIDFVLKKLDENIEELSK